jgi:hypothetical protein
LKQCRKEQGNIIDSTKGLDIKPIPAHWTNWTRITDDMSEEELEIANFNNSILIDKRPQFMRNLYDDYSREYNKYCKKWNSKCIDNFNLELYEILEKKELSKLEKEFVDTFYRFSPLLDTNCEINNISSYMQKRVKELKNNKKLFWSLNMIEPMKKHDIKEWEDSKSDALILLHSKYKSGKRNFEKIKDDSGNLRYQTIEQYNKAIRQEALKLSDSLGELAYYAISRCYISLGESDNKEFVWSIFGSGVIDNIKNNMQDKNIYIPFLDEDGDIEYLGKKYSKKQISLIEEDMGDFL